MTDRPGNSIAPGNRWPLFVVLLVAGFLALTAWSFHRAARGASAVTDNDYYSHGLRFDQTRLEQNAAMSMGWNLETTLSGRLLRVTLKDRSQQPVTAARTILALANGPRGETIRLVMTEDRGGTYTGQLPPALRGEQAARVDIERDGVRLSRQLLLSLP